MAPAALEQLLDRPEVEQLQLLAALQHSPHMAKGQFSGAIEQRARQGGERNPVFEGAVVRGQDARMMELDRKPWLARYRRGHVQRRRPVSGDSPDTGGGAKTQKRTWPAGEHCGQAAAMGWDEPVADRVDA